MLTYIQGINFHVISTYVSISIYFFNQNESTNKNISSLHLNHVYIILEYKTWTDFNLMVFKTSCYLCEEFN